jgi:hypothetical protein
MASIVWPQDPITACNRYLNFIIGVIDEPDIAFLGTRPDPRAVARQYIDGEITAEVYRAEAVAWWEFLESVGGVCGISRQPSALLARSALCLLSVTPDEAPRLAEHLSWFFEVLGFMQVDLGPPRAMMEKYFAHTA